MKEKKKCQTEIELYLALYDTIIHFTTENDLSYSQVYGILELLKMNMYDEGITIAIPKE